MLACILFSALSFESFGCLEWPTEVPAWRVEKIERGIASYYWPTVPRFGHHIAQGGYYDPEGDTCAHKKLMFGTIVRVTDLATTRSVLCVINDRGPFVRGRIIDLTPALARMLDMEKRGIVPVKVEILK